TRFSRDWSSDVCSSDLNYVIKLPLSRITRLIVSAVKQREEERAWDLWSRLYPEMVLPHPLGGKEPRLKFISFDEFMRRLTAPKVQPAAKKLTIQEMYQSFKRKALRPSS